MDEVGRQERFLIDQLHALGLSRFVSLPRIAVVGDTSTGKSSVLSAISGISFPSARNLTTRCPTQVVLSRSDDFRACVRLNRYQSDGKSGNLATGLDQDIDDMDSIPLIIEKITQQLVKEGQTFSDDEIIIQVSGPDLPDLTLTDLPGLVRNVKDGEDPKIIQRVRDMVLRYMKEPRSVILAVVPADVDVHNTEILRLAQEADPMGDRTIAVVTKMDRVQPGDEIAVKELLSNEIQHLKYGYHAIRCRSQEELDAGVSISASREKEEEFFQGHRHWSYLPIVDRGIAALCAKLVQILQMIIRHSLPRVASEINEMLDSSEAELRKRGTQLTTMQARRAEYERILSIYLTNLRDVINGEGTTSKFRAKLWHADADFRSSLDDAFSHFWEQLRSSQMSSEDLSNPKERARLLQPLISEHRGRELSIFPSYGVFQKLVRQIVESWESPVRHLLDQYRSHVKAAASTTLAELNSIVKLRTHVENHVVNELRTAADDAIKVLVNLTNQERLPYTQQASLTATLNAYRSKSIAAHTPTTRRRGENDFAFAARVLGSTFDEEPNVQRALEMETAISAYMEIAIPRMSDACPMALHIHFLEKFLIRLDSRLRTISDDMVDAIFRESKIAREQRRCLEEKVSVLKAAKATVELLV